MRTHNNQSINAGLSKGPTSLTYILTLVFIFTIPWENAVTVSGIGTISRVLGMPLAALWILTVLLQGTIGKIHRVHVWSFFYVFWCAMTLLWSVNPDISITQLKTFMQLFFSMCIVLSVINTREKSINALQAYLLGCWVVALFVIYNYQIGNVTRWSQRASISGVDENDIALVLSTGLPIAWFLSSKVPKMNRNRLLVILNFVYLPIGLTAIIMTGSRGGFSSVLPTAIFIIFGLQNLKLKSKFVAFIALAIALYLVVQYVPETPFRRITETLDEVNNRTISGRWTIWVGGLSLWLDSTFNSVFGLGIGGYSATVGRVAHSTPISVLVESGIIGLSLFLLILSTLVRNAFKAHRDVTWICITLLCVWGIGINALSWEYRKPTWIIWSLISCLATTHLVRANNAKRKKR